MYHYFCIAALLLSISADPLPTNSRIYGGHDTPITQLPYQVSLRAPSFGFFCGGSIVSERFVVTAAHCLRHFTDPSELEVRTGSSYCEAGGSLHQVLRLISHENFTIDYTTPPTNDIALLELAEPLRFDDTRRPIEMYRSSDVYRVGEKAVISGWGAVSVGTYPDHLQSVAIPIVSRSVCNEAYVQQFGGIAEGQICAAVFGVGGKDSCQGDSGGPLVIGAKLAGVVSYGLGCGEPEFPGVYTEVAYYRDWIAQHVGL